MYSESNNLSVVNELLAICDLPLRERDFIEAEKAMLDKTATVLYTIIVACCVAIIGAYGMSAQLGLGFLPIKILFVPLLCLPTASVYYFVFPKWLGILRYRQYETTNNQQRDIAFFKDHFEIRVNDINTGSYLYTFIRRIIISENLYIIVLPNMVVLPVRHVAIPEEKWNIIQRCINTAMAALKNRPSTKNTDMANDHNRFTRLMCFGLVIMLCSLFLIPYEDKETIEVVADNELTESIYRNMVSEQSFDLSLNDWGSVTFVSCMPDPDADADPLTDASFYLIRDGELLYRFPYVAENNVREAGLCENISFVFFADSNEDLRDDVIIGVQYVSGAGPQGMIPYTEVRIYEDSGNSSFVYNGTLSHEINTNLPAEATAEYVKSFLANYLSGRS